MLNSTKKIKNLGIDQPDLIMVSHDKSKKKYIFHSKSPIGYFKISQLIKYIGTAKHESFMNDIDMDVSKDVIETFIIKIDQNSDSPNQNNIEIINYLQSPFTGNIEMLMKLLNDLKDFEKNELNHHLNKIQDVKIQKKIICFIKYFIFILLNHMIKLISSITNHIKNDSSKQKLKNQLHTNSCIIMQHINNYILDQIDHQYNLITTLKNNIHDIAKVKISLNNKIESGLTIIKSQNLKIIELIDKSIGQIGGIPDVQKSKVENDENNENNEKSTPSQSSDIIEEIYTLIPMCVAEPDMSKMLDSENAYITESGNDNNKNSKEALKYLSSEEKIKDNANEPNEINLSESENKITPHDHKIKLNKNTDQSVIDEIYNI